MNNPLWAKAQLSQLIDVKHGFAFKGEFFTDKTTQNMLLTPGNFAIGGGFLLGKPKYYTGSFPDEYILDRGDLIISMTDLSKNMDTLGYPALVPCDSDMNYLHNQRLGKVIIKNPDRLDKSFLYYLLCSKDYRNEIKAGASGSVIRHTSPDRIKKFSFSLPPLHEQRAIADVLSALDDKIDLNRRMNRTLESLAQALFKHMFLDYPERGGWKKGIMEDLCLTIENGGTPKRMEESYWKDGDIYWYKTGELSDSPLIESEEKITSLGLKNSACKIWAPKTILIALYASPTVGRLGILEASATANQACSALIAKPEIGYLFVFFTLLNSRTDLQNIAVGAAQQNINQQIVRQHKVVIPPVELVSEFNSYVEPLYKQTVLNIKEIKTLTELRDTLLPKLMSGQVRVKIE